MSTVTVSFQHASNLQYIVLYCTVQYGSCNVLCHSFPSLLNLMVTYKHLSIDLFLPLISIPPSLLFYLLVFNLLYLMLFLLILFSVSPSFSPLLVTVSDSDIVTAHIYK